MKKFLALVPCLVIVSCKSRTFNSETNSVRPEDKSYYQPSELSVLRKSGDNVVRTICPGSFYNDWQRVSLNSCKSDPKVREWTPFVNSLRTAAKLPDAEFDEQIAKLATAMEKNSVKDIQNLIKKEIRENLNRAFVEAGKALKPLRDDELIGTNQGSGFGSHISFTFDKDLMHNMYFYDGKIYDKLPTDAPKGAKGAWLRVTTRTRQEYQPPNLTYVYKAGTTMLGQITSEGRMYEESFDSPIAFMFAFGELDKIQNWPFTSPVPDEKITVGEFKQLMNGILRDIEIRP